MVKQTNKDIKFPYYSGDIYDSRVKGYVTIRQFIRSHKSPVYKMSDLFTRIAKANEDEDFILKRQLKQGLFSFTPSVMINIGDARKYQNIKNWTGLIQLDFDKIPDEKTAQDLKEHLFSRYHQKEYSK